MKNCLTNYLFFAFLILVSCGKESTNPEWGWDKGEDKVEKPRYLWVDAAANFPDFANSKENIIRDLTLARDAGFTDVVVDVRPTTGDILFQSTHCDQVKWLGAWTSTGYTKIERTATWDYLQAFIDEGHKLELKVHAAINTFTGGNSTNLGSQGLLFRDDTKKTWATTLNLKSGLTNTMDESSINTKFFNPLLPQVQNYICDLLKDLSAYTELDGIILDRGRFDGLMSDFSPYTKSQFEIYIGRSVDNFPSDILAAGSESKLPESRPKHLVKWLEYRAKGIHDFMVKARNCVKSINGDIMFGVYVGGWYSTYYDVGVNWASPNYQTSSKYSWASVNYNNFGYADHMDQMLIGAYAAPNRVNGTSEWTMEGFCLQAKDKIGKSCPRVCGGPDVGNWDSADKFPQVQENDAITKSVAACYNACDGYFLFDMIHLKKANQWQFVEAGINGVIKK